MTNLSAGCLWWSSIVKHSETKDVQKKRLIALQVYLEILSKEDGFGGEYYHLYIQRG